MGAKNDNVIISDELFFAAIQRIRMPKRVQEQYLQSKLQYKTNSYLQQMNLKHLKFI